MNNRCLLLLALLVANRRFGQPPVPRTVVVKQAFLAEKLRPLYHYWRRTFQFERYYHGPYTDDIFFRLGVLICNGLVRVESSTYSRGRHLATYSATESGVKLLQRFSGNELVQLAEDIVWSLQAVGVEQAGSICRLVYQESAFANVLSQQTQQGIGPEARTPLAAVTDDENETLETLFILKHLSKPNAGAAIELPPRELIRSYLKLLADRVSSAGSVTPSAA